MQTGIEVLKQLLGDKFFGVTFTKKDGTLRKMVARLKVTKGVNGKGMNHNPADHGNMIVWDLKKKAYRTIKLEKIQELRFRGAKIKL